MAFRRTKRTYDEESLYEYAVGALGRRMRTVAEIRRLMRTRVGDQPHGDLLVDVVVARLKHAAGFQAMAQATSSGLLKIQAGPKAFSGQRSGLAFFWLGLAWPLASGQSWHITRERIRE